MPNVNDLKNSQFLTKEDVEPPIVVTIKGYKEENVEMEGESERKKWTLTFREVDKPLVLNMTNGQRIQVVTGSAEFDDWIGKKITLYNDKTVSFAGKLTGGIRVFVQPPNIPTPTEGQPNPEYREGGAAFCQDCGKITEDCTCNIPF